MYEEKEISRWEYESLVLKHGIQAVTFDCAEDIGWLLGDSSVVALQYPNASSGCSTCGYGGEEKWFLYAPVI